MLRTLQMPLVFSGFSLYKPIRIKSLAQGHNTVLMLGLLQIQKVASLNPTIGAVFSH